RGHEQGSCRTGAQWGGRGARGVWRDKDAPKQRTAQRWLLLSPRCLHTSPMSARHPRQLAMIIPWMRVMMDSLLLEVRVMKRQMASLPIKVQRMVHSSCISNKYV
uniref:Uncharacterized protein n=1 Tax=Aegilops tauschii subsp. strangulata TaxID=200361 RepID=A0A453PMJ1_AEGTS